MPQLLKANLHRPFCITQQGRVITRATLLSDALTLSKKLPSKKYVINLCQQRYFFIVSYLAAVFKGQITLLPPNKTTGTLNQLLTHYPDSYCLSDDKTIKSPTIIIDWADFEGDDDDYPLINPFQIISILFTSGSTGTPKAQPKTWRELQQAALLALQQFNLQKSTLTLVSTIPMQHMYGLESCLFWVLFSTLTLHNSHPFYPQDIQLLLKTLPEAMLVSTPRHLKTCLSFQGKPYPVQKILSSTAPLSLSLATEIERYFNAPLFEIYGSTETSSFASRRTAITKKWTLYQDIELYQQHSHFFVKGGHIFKPVPLDDYFSINQKGYFEHLGRSDDLIKIAGKRASLTELNQLLTQLPNIEDGVFFKLKNERLGAFVVSNALKKHILVDLKHSIDAVFLPRSLYYIDKLPRNDTGKLIQSELNRLIHERTDA
ncbi:MAG: acyl-CoA synthetase [Methylococcales bacterium]|nr:acyl-CoA synthetase [Methylococcales bacterium]